MIVLLVGLFVFFIITTMYTVYAFQGIPGYLIYPQLAASILFIIWCILELIFFCFKKTRIMRGLLF